VTEDPRIAALPDIHGHAKGEHKPFAEERPIPYTARMLFLWFYHACRRGSPRFLMVADHMNYLTFEDPAAVNLVRRALKLAQAGDLYGAAETAGVELGHAAVVSEGLRKGMRYSIGAEVDNDPRSRPDAQNIVDAMRPDGMVRSVHFLPINHPQHGENWMWAFDNPEFKEFYDVLGTDTVWELYMATLLDAIDKLPGHIVGHFYVPAKFGHWPDDAKLEEYEDKLLDACAERGMAVEINSRYIYKYNLEDPGELEKYVAANRRLLAKAKAKGVMIAVGSDAHSPRDQGNAFDTVLQMLDEADINEIAFPINGRLARVALRATEELLRQQAAAIAPPLALPPPPRPQPVEEDVAVEVIVAERPIVAKREPAAKNGVPAESPVGAPHPPKPKRAPKKPVKAAEPAAVESAAETPALVAEIAAPAAEKPTVKAPPKAAHVKPPAAEKVVAAKPAAKKAATAKVPAIKKIAPILKSVAKVAGKIATAIKPAKPPVKAAPVKKKDVAKKGAAKKPAATAAAKKAPPKRVAPAAKHLPNKSVSKKPAAKIVAKRAAASKKSAPAKKAAAAKKSAKKTIARKSVKRSAAPKQPAAKKAVVKKSTATKKRAGSRR
jgi:HisJ family histidinol phosphate phosphatase